MLLPPRQSSNGAKVMQSSLPSAPNPSCAVGLWCFALNWEVGGTLVFLFFFFPVLPVCCGLVLTRCWADSSGKVSVWVVRGRQTSELLQEVLLRGSFVPRKCLCCFEIEKR